eukprot:3841868-Rhodomonas_salina.1
MKREVQRKLDLVQVSLCLSLCLMHETWCIDQRDVCALLPWRYDIMREDARNVQFVTLQATAQVHVRDLQGDERMLLKRMD